MRGEAAVLSPIDKMLAKEAIAKAVKSADTELWTTTTLNIWTRPDQKAKKLGELDGAKKVLVTGRTMNGREEIVLDGEARWVTAGYLSADKPFAIGGDCTNGTTVPSGVSANIKLVHEAVCANFPEITVYGTFRGDGDHAQGLAVDIMVSGDSWLSGRGVRPGPLRRARRQLRDLLPAHLVGRPLRGGLAWHGGPWVRHRQPLRPRARHDVLRWMARATSLVPRAALPRRG